MAVKIIFQLSLDTGVVPTDWLISNITPILKKGDRTVPSNYRSVNLTSVASIIFEHILKSNVMKHLDKHQILCENQHGFRRNHSCETQLINTTHEIACLLDQKHQVDMIIMDFAKAFDKVPHRRLLLKLDRYGIRGKALNWTEAFLTQRKQRVVIDGKCSEWVDVKSSVPQGTVTGPMDFLVFINDLPQNLTSSVKLFADDCIVFRKVSGPEDAGMLQKDLDVLTAWQSKWQMAFNAQKCYVLRVTHSKSPKKFIYTLNNTELAEKKEYPYLGVTLTSNWSWNSHVNNTAAKANRTLGFIKRNLHSCSKQVKNLAYKSLVRPTMEYCGSVWDPSTKELKQKLESVQNRGARFVTADYRRTSSVSHMKQELKWEPLEERRRVTRVCILHQAQSGRLAIPTQTILRPVVRSSRHGSYIQIPCNKNCLKFSFMPKTLIDWNALPQHIKEIEDKDNFKAAVAQHYSQKPITA